VAGVAPVGAVPAATVVLTTRLEALVAALSVGQATVVIDGSGTAGGVATALADLGIGAVEVRTGANADLVTTVDLLPGLTRVTEGPGSALWRVSAGGEPAPGWARLVASTPILKPGVAPAAGTAPAAGAAPAAGQTLAVLPSDGRTVRTAIPAADPAAGDRLLVLASAPDTGWHATLDGQRLTAVVADGLQAFALPATGGALRVAHVSGHEAWWLWTGGAVLLVYVLLALPVGRRRGR
jgi:hypothetical protein